MFNILFNFFLFVELFFVQGKGMYAVFIRNKETEIQVEVTAPGTGWKSSGRVIF